MCCVVRNAAASDLAEAVQASRLASAFGITAAKDRESVSAPSVRILRLTRDACKRLRLRGPCYGPLKKSLQIGNGAYRDRTDDLRLAKPALSQLS